MSIMAEAANPVYHPRLIVIEGLDGTGKTTTCNWLIAELKALAVTNPPASMRSARAAADRLPEQEKREWYLSANRAALIEAIEHANGGQWVVMDRSIASTLAFWRATLGSVATIADLPPGFQIPRFFYLQVSEATRLARWSARNEQKTSEENRLQTDRDFRARVDQGYMNLGGLPTSAEASTEEIGRSIISIHERLGRPMPQ